MITIESVDLLRRQIQRWRKADDSIALVPTMGNLHPGHLKLVEEATALADRVVVSIFVNPMQFGEGEDFGAYPRTLEEDAAALKERGTDLLFTPGVADVYTSEPDRQTRVEVPQISSILCGAARPGHFVGVSTVVCKLFCMVQPDIAVFGDKDYQQLMVIRRMTLDLSFPIQIRGVPTVREDDGLARSSRNGYLTPEERGRAPLLYRTIQKSAERILSGKHKFRTVEKKARKKLKTGGFKPDYFRVLRAADLGEPTPGEKELVIVAAAHLGRARLIDNMTLTR
ncbi:MAG: pantoate--beta-alanine ligase [Gammaproteobacteria bacterium]|nr:pantoate--beta-alanine ligase [Gammaproteobacteria bacterium]